MTNQKLDRNWYAVYTKFRSEKFSASLLNKKGIEVFLPLTVKIKKYAKVIKKYEVPLINSYLFVRIMKEDISKVLATEGIYKFVQQGLNNLNSIPNVEIEILKRITGLSEEIESKPIDFNPGMEVEVVSGHLVGLKGKVIGQENKKQLIVELQNIGYQFRISIDPSFLQVTKHAV